MYRQHPRRPAYKGFSPSRHAPAVYCRDSPYTTCVLAVPARLIRRLRLTRMSRRIPAASLLYRERSDADDAVSFVSFVSIRQCALTNAFQPSQTRRNRGRKYK